MSATLPPDCSELLARRLADLPEVRLAYLFGSRARGSARPESDLATLRERAAGKL